MMGGKRERARGLVWPDRDRRSGGRQHRTPSESNRAPRKLFHVLKTYRYTLLRVYTLLLEFDSFREFAPSQKDQHEEHCSHLKVNKPINY